MLDPDCKDQDTLALVRYIAEEDKLEKILENPIERIGNQEGN